MSPERERFVVLAATGLAYFVVFPEDLAPLRDVLALTNAVSPWLYGTLLGSGMAWAMVRCFGRRTGEK
jgi:hypothetical protein